MALASAGIVTIALVACPIEDNEDDDDDEVPTATFAAATSAIMEGASDTIGVTLSADAGADGVAVQFGVVSDGTTAEDDDWQITTGGSSGVAAIPGSATTWRVTIPSGSNSATIAIVTSNDTDLEDETLIFELQEESNYSVGDTSRHTLTIDDLTPVFTLDPGETSYSFEINEGNYTRDNPGMVGMVTANPAARYEISAGNIGTRFAITDNEAGNGVITAIGGLDFEVDAIPNSYTLTVTAYNGADATDPNATAMVAISVNNIEAGLLSSIAAYEVTVDEDGAFIADATDQRQSLAGNAAGTPLNLGAIATVDNFILSTFTITPPSPFMLTKAAGRDSDAMLEVDASGLDYETLPDRGDGTRGYTLTVSATGAMNSNTITLNITVTDVDYVTAADLTVQEDADMLELMLSAVDGTTTYTVAGIRSVDTPDTPFSVAAGPPLPNMLTVAPAELDVEDDNKPDSYSDVVITIEIDGGELDNDVEIITVGTITVDPAPGFLNSPPTLFLREDGLFVAVGDTTLATQSNIIDLAETSEYTFVKGGFVPSNVTPGTLDPEPDGGTATFTLSGTMLMIDDDTADNFDTLAGTQRYSLPITDGTDTSATTTLTVEIVGLAQEGTTEEPYLIDSVTELQSIDTGFSNEVITIALSREDSLATRYLLTADLDLTGHDPDGDGSGFNPIGDCGEDNICSNTDDNQFIGSFDGDGHTIANLTINRPSLEGVGLFAITIDAVVRNVALTGVDVIGDDLAAGLVGFANTTRIDRIAISGSVEGSTSLGLLIGTASGRISNSFAIGTIDGTRNNVGLLVGNHIGILTANTYAVGMVSGNTNTGILLGANRSNVVNNYASGSLTANSAFGAITGRQNSGDFQNTYWNSDPAQIDANGTAATADDTPQSPKQGVGNRSPDPAGIIAKTEAELTALNGMAIADDGTNGSNWRVQFDIDNADHDNNPTTGTTDIESVRCDSDGDGEVEATDAYIWNFDSASQYPVLNCMPLTPAEQRALIDQFAPIAPARGASLSATDGAEDDSNPTNGVFTLRLTGAPSQDATVTYTLGGTAGTEYTAFGTGATNSRLEGSGVTGSLSNMASGAFTITSPHVNTEATIILVPANDSGGANETITLTIASITFADSDSGTDILGSAIGGTGVSGGALSLTIVDDGD